jgi:hypothetical protein
MKISKIVSGAQTGVDQGALEACQWIDFPYGGWVPKGRRTEAGTLQDRFKGMQEHPSADYLKRTEANVVDSDATLVLTPGRPTGGSKKTIEYAKKHGRPCHHLDMSKPMDEEVQKVLEWLNESCPDGCTLNVAGARESKNSGIQKATLVWMLEILGKDKGTVYYPPPMRKKWENNVRNEEAK